MAIVADVSGRLTTRGIRHLIGGSFASSAWGEMRTTNDADIAVMVEKSRVFDLVEAFSTPYYIDRARVDEALDEQGPYRMAHALHMDEAFPGTFVPFSAPENIVLQKLRWFEVGKRVSDRQWNDIVRVLEYQRFTFDYAYLHHWAQKLGVAEMLEAALAQRTDEPDPYA